MKFMTKLLISTSALILSGCTSEGASMGQFMQDNFSFTSAQNIPASEVRCFILTKPYTFKAGSWSLALPSGKYIARKKNKTGYFYYAPSPITVSGWSGTDYQDGVYLDNQKNKGSLFSKKPGGFDDRPIRSAALPNAIFASIKMNVKC